MRSNDKQLFEIASVQEGYFTARQAMKAGYQFNNHPYHVKRGNWIREHRGIYRLSNFPTGPDGQYVLWVLWSCNRQGKPQGVYSFDTALNIYEVSDVMPAKLHMTVPINFRRSTEIPAVIELHRAELREIDVRKKNGYSVTTPLRTILDLVHSKSTPEEIIKQAVVEFRVKGLLTENELVKLVETEPSLAKYIIGSQGKKR